MRDDARVTKRIGLTPILVRLAWDCLKKGVGRHYLEHPEYDNVVVSELYSWTVRDHEGQAGLLVEFCKGRESLKQVEFGARFVGGRGEEAFRLL